MRDYLKAGIGRTSFDYGTQPVGLAQSPSLSYQAGLLLHAYNRSRLSVQLETMVLALRGDYAPAAVYTGDLFLNKKWSNILADYDA
ncbi:hypothetical protein GCM10011495_23800 [Hymenobacter frigidus]|uniref:Uncharacterized protein n=1 Tax=Hymenobacter frigidus TaxID=1524095 RepID=A0ABQ2A5W3_9BACT|nr:hypothetical protein [Hymenobacter frigidus]GGH86677.1 hypothetical protein GCM10011495_23800 [Hymenobacter frigidus]